jgi:hypothetical protein
MRWRLLWVPLCVLLSVPSAPVLGETVFLKDGEEVVGQIVARTPNAIVVKEWRTGLLRTIKRVDIDMILAEPAAPPGRVTAPTPEPPKAEAAKTAKAAKPKAGETTPAKTSQGKQPKAGETKAAGAGEGGKAEPGKETAAGEEGKAEPGKETAAGEEGKAEPGKETAAGEEGKAEPGKEPGKAAEGENAEAKKPEVSPELKKIFADAMVQLDSEDPTERAAGKRAIEEAGTDIIPALVEGLNHKRTEARAAVADLLGSMNARNAVKQLIESFYAALPDAGRPAAYQTVFIRALGNALSNVTGQTFITTEAKNELVQGACQQYVDWYNSNYDRLPKQVGEPEIKPTDPDYVAKLKEVRQLKLVKRDWPRPPMPADIIQGQEKVEMPEGAPTTRKDDIEYGKSVQRVDRATMDGVVREADKSFGRDFFRGKKTGEE